MATGLRDAHRLSWEEQGYFLIPGFAGRETCAVMEARIVELARRAHAERHLGETPAVAVDRALVVPEARRDPAARAPEDYVSKIFRLHRDEPVFAAFARSERLLDLVQDLLGPDLDCFLSQFIFKNPAAMGQPWHQDGYYFPFDREPQVGVWLAVSAATPENGPLHVLPGSHREPIHEHVPDRRPDANYGYVEIVDHDMSQAVAVLMQPGDLLIFHSRLMHCSTDNTSDSRRAAMVYHYAQAGTEDRSSGIVNDWVPVRRAPS